MSSRRNREGRANAFAGGDSLETPIDLGTADKEIFGSIVELDNARRTIKPISIFDIQPDPLQPRRPVPSPVRPYWDGKPSTIGELFANWYELAEQECGHEFAVEPYLLAQEEVARPEHIGPIQSSFLDILELAANIRKNGLTNPITVVRTADGYRLETGERRWLSYHILLITFHEDQKQWERIPAHVVEEFNVWRQAGENNARSELNAISRARQLAILLMDIYRQQGYSFYNYGDMVGASGIDRPYYAQVADGNQFSARGHDEALRNALGFKQSSQMREHRELLRIPDEVWRIADDLNWAQGRIRDLKRQADGDDLLFIKLARSAAFKDGYTVGIPTPTDSPTPSSKMAGEVENPLFSSGDQQRFSKLRKLAVKVGQGDKPLKNKDILDIQFEIQQMREWLDRLDQAARSQFRKS